MTSAQQFLFRDDSEDPTNRTYPSTRYQGSKRALVGWIWENVRHLPFDNVLDVFGGTGVVSHTFKVAGKEVTYNDNLAFNWQIGLALIENATVTLTSDDVELILNVRDDFIYPTFIQTTFPNIYFTDDENAWLDRVVFNIDHALQNPMKQAIARFALFQACIIKRPYNLFHRANLYMREASVKRSFGNKTTWDTPFETHFKTFVNEANAAVFSNGRSNHALCLDAFDTPKGADLVYIDPPYLNRKGKGVDYRDFYHFLEGLTNYPDWSAAIDYKSRHKRLVPKSSVWHRAGTILNAFDALIAHHRESMIVISYRDDGIPSKQDLLSLLNQYKRNVTEAVLPKKYALSQTKSHELLLIGT